MELCVDLNIRCNVAELESLIMKFNLMEKVAGKDLENLSYIEKNSGAKISFNAKWTGIQDGLTFKIRDEEITAVKEAEFLLRQLLQSIREKFANFKEYHQVPSDAVVLQYESNTATCGICGRTYPSTLSQLEKHVASHSLFKQAVHDKPPWLLDRLGEVRGDEREFVHTGRRFSDTESPSPERFSPENRHSSSRARWTRRYRSRSPSMSPERRHRSPSPPSRRSSRYTPPRKYAGRNSPLERTHRFSPERRRHSRSPTSRRSHRYFPDRRYSSPSHNSRSRRSRSSSAEGRLAASKSRSAWDRREYSPVRSPKRLGFSEDLPIVLDSPERSVKYRRSRSRSRSPRRHGRHRRSRSRERRGMSPRRHRRHSYRRSRSRSRSKSRSREWERKQSRRIHSRSLPRSRSRSPLKCDATVEVTPKQTSTASSSVQHGSVSQAISAIGKLSNLGNYLGAASVQPPEIGIAPQVSVGLNAAVPSFTPHAAFAGLGAALGANIPGHQQDMESFPDMTQEILLHPHRSEPRYVAHGRKEVLQRYRSNGKISDLDCEKLIILLEPQVQLKNKDKYYIKHIPQELKKNNIDPKNPTNGEKLTAKLMVLCDFLVKKTELRKPDPGKPYPYLKDLRFAAAWESGNAPWQKQIPQPVSSTAAPVHPVPFPAPVAVPFVSAPLPVVTGMAPPPSQFAGETPVWVVKDWYRDITNLMIMRPHFHEPLYVAIGRRDILLRERSQGFLNDSQTEELLASLTLKLFAREQNRLLEIVTQYTNLLGFTMANVPSETQLLSIKLMANCDFFIERCHIPTTEKRKKDMPYPLEGRLLKECPGPYPGRFVVKPGWPHIGGIPLPLPPVGDTLPSPPVKYVPSMSKVPEPVSNPQPSVSTVPRANLVQVQPIIIPSEDEEDSKKTPPQSTSSVMKPDSAILIPDDDALVENRSVSPDVQIPHVSCNGQYEKFDPSQLSDKLAVQNYVVVLAAQNKVEKTFAKITFPDFKHVHEIKIGGESYVGKSNYTVTEAKRNVAYETLMRTRYAFSDIPEELKMFKPKRGLPTHAIVGTKDPLDSARNFVHMLATQNKITPKYEVLETEDGWKKATLTLDTEIFYATTATDEAALKTVAYIALQKTTCLFSDPPENIVTVPPSNQDIRGDNKQYNEMLSKCDDIMKRRRRQELDENGAQAAAKQLKHMGSLSAKEVQLISKKLSKLAVMARKSKISQSGWKWWRITKHLEYTIDLVLKKLSHEKYDGEVWVNEVTSDPDYKTDFKLDTLSNKDDSKGSGTVDITKEKLGKDKKKAEEKNDDEEMDIYEDVMKLEIKTQPLVQAIVLSDDDDDNVAEETERDAEKQNMDADKLNKTNTALPADKNLETGSKTLNGNTAKIASLEETSGAKASLNATTITQNLVADAKASTSAETNAADEDQNSDDDTAMIIDDEVAETTARTRVYVRKRKLGSDNALDTTVAPEKEMSGKVSKVAKATAENRHSNVQAETNVPKDQEPPQTKSAEVPQEGNTPDTVQQAQSTDGKQPSDVLKSRPVQKSKRRLIAVSAASIAAGVLTGLGVSAEKDTAQKTGTDDISSGAAAMDPRNTATLSRIPQIEDEDLTDKPMEERHAAMKKKIDELLEKREKDELSSVETGEIIKAIKEHLSKEDMIKVNKTTSKFAKQHFKTTGEKSPSPTWKLTVRLKVLCRYILHKLQNMVGEKRTEEEKNVNEWLKGKAVAYYQELSTGSLTSEQIKERVEALKLNLSEDQKVVLNRQFIEECRVILSMLNPQPHLKAALRNVVDLELTSLYIIQQSSGTEYPVCCLLSKTFADIMLAKSSEGRIKESEVLKIIKSSLTVQNESSKNTSEEANEVVELDSVQTKEMSTKPPAALERPAGIKLTLTSNTKSTIEAEKRQQTKKAKLAKTEQDASVIANDSDSD